MDERAQTRLLETLRSLRLSPDAAVALPSLADLACELTASDAALILRPDEERTHLTVLAASRGMEKIPSFPAGQSLAEIALQHGRPLIAADGECVHEMEALGVSIQSALAAPLIFRGETLGVIEIVRRTNGPHYTEDEVTTLETLASLAALLLREQSLTADLDSSRQEAAELERLKSDFIAITSHELRTPLGLILGHATFLRELVDSQFYEQLDIIIRNATRLKEIVESLSRVDNFASGAARVRQRSISMAELVHKVADSFAEEARQKGVRLEASTGAGRLPVAGEAGKIEIALANIVKNAITFSEPGGQVVISAEAMPGFVKVTVADDGIGIPVADLPRVFDRFYQVESHLTRKHGGMGLGLTVAKSMVEMHGGKIWAESEEGKGSTFILLLPAEHMQLD